MIEFEEADFNLRELMGNIRAASLQIALEKGILLKLMVDEDIPQFLKGDTVRLAQVFTNLVSNAVKFTEAGKVTITAQLVAQHAETTTIAFEIKDTGIGIPQDKLSHIFNRFTQASSDTTRKFGGTGLGLAIVAKLLELQQSEIKVESIPGKGSRFFFDLSFKNSSSKPAQQTTSPSHSLVKNLNGLRILVAEDNEVNVLLMKRYLELWGACFDVAENGQVAVAKVQAADFDLVLMDLQMPVLDGYGATEAIRNLGEEKYRQLPIIALTATATLDSKDKPFAAGMNDYVSKPFNSEEFYRKLAGYKKKS